MTAPTNPFDQDDDLYPANQENPFLAPEPARADDPDLAPLRVDVSLAVFAAVWVGMVAAQVAEIAPGSSGIAYLGALIAALLLIRWTRKR